MPYVVLQRELAPPDQQRYVDALTNSGIFTRPDVKIMGRHISAILARSLSMEDAQAVQSALAEQGIASDVVDQSQVLPLPAAKRTNRMDCTPPCLLVRGPTGQAIEVAWPNIAVLACGLVTRSEQRTEKVSMPGSLTPDNASPLRSSRTMGQYTVVPNFMYFDKQVERQVTLLEIVTPEARYQLIQDEAAYAGLGERVGRNARESFLTLLGDMRALAKDAWLNSGAAGLLGQPPQEVAYGHERLFDDELAWLLWKSRQNDGNP